MKYILFVVVADDDGHTFEQSIGVIEESEKNDKAYIDKIIKRYQNKCLGSKYYVADWYIG